MATGERTQTVVLQQRPVADAVDTSGAPTEVTEWTTLVASMPAGKYDLQGAEKLRAEQLSARYDTRWEINYRADMDPDLLDVAKLRRILHRGRIHDIVAASVIERRDGIELMTLTGMRTDG
jgi:head-tail adaptor